MNKHQIFNNSNKHVNFLSDAADPVSVSCCQLKDAQRLKLHVRSSAGVKKTSGFLLTCVNAESAFTDPLHSCSKTQDGNFIITGNG